MRYSYIPDDILDVWSHKIEESGLHLPLSDAAAAQLFKASGLVDEDYYFLTNPDVRAAGADPATHFASYGWKEGRNPSLWFDVSLYKNENPELDADINPLLHYIFAGRKEGRRPNANVLPHRSRLIVSLSPLASEGAKLNDCLASLLAQSLKAENIIVQLPRQKYRDRQFCFNFLEMVDQGVELRWCEDCGGYNNLLPTLIEYPQDIIVTCGCGNIYPKNFLDDLLITWRKYPQDIICVATAKAIRKNGRLEYEFGRNAYYANANLLNIPRATGGMLLPPGAFGRQAQNMDICLRNAFTYPDLWYWLMAIVYKRKIRRLVSDSTVFSANEAYSKPTDPDTFAKEAENLLYLFRKEVAANAGINFYSDILQDKVENIYKKQTNKTLDLNNCCDFNEKIQFLKLHEDLPIKSLLADKYHARKYIRRCLGNEAEQYLIRLHGVWTRFDDIDFSTLPEKFVLKTNNACGTNYIVNNKNNFNMTDCRNKFAGWMHKNYAHNWGEMNYASIKPLIICEEYLGDNIWDYKFLCHHGKVEYCWVDIDRFGPHKRNFYSLDWELQDILMDYPNSHNHVPKPHCLPTMLAIAQKLTQPFVHARVDFFLIGRQLKIGEITFFTQSGYGKFEPEDAAIRLGAGIDLSRLGEKDTIVELKNLLKLQQ